MIVGAAARHGRPLRRLLRHLLRAGLRRPAPRAGAQRRARRRLPDVRRDRAGTPPRGRRCGRRSTSSAGAASACRDGGRSFLDRAAAGAGAVRAQPWRGHRRTTPTAGRMQVTVDGPELVSVAFGATYSPAFYRELDRRAAVGAAPATAAPLLRLVAEATGGGTDAGAPRDYSEGLDAAVACHDYPQLYDMTSPPGAAARAASTPRRSPPRRTRPLRAVHGRTSTPRSDWQELDWCTRWPVAPADNPAGPPARPAATTRTCRCWCSAASWTRSPRRPRATSSPAVPARPAGGRAQQLPRHRGRRHRRLRGADRTHLRAVVRGPAPAAQLRGLGPAGARAGLLPRVALGGAPGPGTARCERGAPPGGRADRGRPRRTAGGTTTPAPASACTAARGATPATRRWASGCTGSARARGLGLRPRPLGPHPPPDDRAPPALRRRPATAASSATGTPAASTPPASRLAGSRPAPARCSPCRVGGRAACGVRGCGLRRRAAPQRGKCSVHTRWATGCSPSTAAAVMTTS